jgi:hypothetical protein
MGESAFRDTDEGLRATLAKPSQRANEVGAHVDRARLARFEPTRCAQLEKKWTAAARALREATTTESLVLACDAHRTLIAGLEDAVANRLDDAALAAILERERRARLWNRGMLWAGVAVILACGTIASCNACYKHIIDTPMNFN